MATVMLLVIGIVGTTVAPWQLFFQQSYVIDKRITPRFMRYEKADLWIGIVDRGDRRGGRDRRHRRRVRRDHGRGQLHRLGRARAGIAAHAGRAAGVLFAVALLDASIIGAFAVSLSTAYAIGDVLGLKHSLHRGFRQAKGFYAIYAALIAGAATIVLIPGTPLGLLTEGVQALAGVLLPSATVYLLLLCTDHAVLGPWVNGRKTNMFASAVAALLVALSVVLTASVLFPGITARQIIQIMCVCAAAAAIGGAWALARGRRSVGGVAVDRTGRDSWRMPPLAMLAKPAMSTSRKAGLTVLRSYLAIAMILVIVRIVQMAIGH